MANNNKDDELERKRMMELSGILCSSLNDFSSFAINKNRQLKGEGGNDINNNYDAHFELKK